MKCFAVLKLLASTLVQYHTDIRHYGMLPNLVNVNMLTNGLGGQI